MVRMKRTSTTRTSTLGLKGTPSHENPVFKSLTRWDSGSEIHDASTSYKNVCKQMPVSA